MGGPALAPVCGALRAGRGRPSGWGRLATAGRAVTGRSHGSRAGWLGWGSLLPMPRLALALAPAAGALADDGAGRDVAVAGQGDGADGELSMSQGARGLAVAQARDAGTVAMGGTSPGGRSGRHLNRSARPCGMASAQVGDQPGGGQPRHGCGGAATVPGPAGPASSGWFSSSAGRPFRSLGPAIVRVSSAGPVPWPSPAAGRLAGVRVPGPAPQGQRRWQCRGT